VAEAVGVHELFDGGEVRVGENLSLRYTSVVDQDVKPVQSG